MSATYPCFTLNWLISEDMYGINTVGIEHGCHIWTHDFKYIALKIGIVCINKEICTGIPFHNIK